ncbi:MAG: hypothetical protein HUU06_01535 [Planctomycetaceae bacterium]|nr:hypothetical protein [Planctomycetota bacterium]NUN51455.1 hypothetical protein [Planctomycetaceae bacterium]
MTRRMTALLTASGLAMVGWAAVGTPDSKWTERVCVGFFGGLLSVLGLAELAIPTTLRAWEGRMRRRGNVRWVARVRRLGGVGSIPAAEREVLLEVAKVFHGASPEELGRCLAASTFEWPVLHRMLRYDLAPSLWYWRLTADKEEPRSNPRWLLKAVVLNRAGRLRKLTPLRWALALLATMPVASEWRQVRREFLRERGRLAGERKAVLPPEARPAPGD